MKKKIIIIISAVVLVALAIGGAYAIDMNRMNNNKLVVFSTWGKQYVPPVNDYPPENGVNPDDKQSFVGTVLEETTSYMIVEPSFEKVDPYIAEKVKVEYETNHYDYLYGIGRKVVIYYKGEPEDIGNGMKLIKTDDISTEGSREFELKVILSDEKLRKEIVERTPPTDSSGKRWTYGDAALYYYGVENVLIDLPGWTMPLEQALQEGRITLNGIIAKCNLDVTNGIIEKIAYDDGGSQIYKYPEYTIIKYHTLDGNRDVYIGSTDMDIGIADK